MTLGDKIHVLYANALSVLEHRIAQPGARRHLFGYGALIVVALLGAFALVRSVRNALDWGQDAGTPVTFHPIKAHQRGDVVETPYPEKAPRPRAAITPRNAKGRKALEALGVDTKKETVIGTVAIERAPYGVDLATTIDNVTGEVKEKGVVRNPLAALDNRPELLLGAYFRKSLDAKAKDGDHGSLTGHIGFTWEMASFRLGKTGYRVYLKPGVHVFAAGGPTTLFGGVDLGIHAP